MNKIYLIYSIFLVPSFILCVITTIDAKDLLLALNSDITGFMTGFLVPGRNIWSVMWRQVPYLLHYLWGSANTFLLHYWLFNKCNVLFSLGHTWYVHGLLLVMHSVITLGSAYCQTTAWGVKDETLAVIVRGKISTSCTMSPALNKCNYTISIFYKHQWHQ